MSEQACYEDAFNMLCGEKIGEGCHREVFECKLIPEVVVKVEKDTHRMFANVMEAKFWEDFKDYPKVADWLAPVTNLSPDGRILLQARCAVLNERDHTIPEKLPAFLTDTKYENFGVLDGGIVCLDYAFTIVNPRTNLRRVDWW